MKVQTTVTSELKPIRRTKEQTLLYSWNGPMKETLGADFKNNQTTKQVNKSIQTNRKLETKLYLLPIGPIVYLLSCLIVFKIRSLE